MSVAATQVTPSDLDTHSQPDRARETWFPARSPQPAGSFKASGPVPIGRARSRRTLRAFEDESPAFLGKLRAQDPSAFARLAVDFRDRIYNLALRITRNADDAQDILQETLLSTFVNIKSFEGRSKLSTWIHVIACNAALSRKRRRSSTDVPYDEGDPLNGAEHGSAPRNTHARFARAVEDPLLLEELQDRLDRAIDCLPPIYREMFVLKELQFASIRDIACAFGVKPGAVKTRIHRARLMLRSQLGDYWDGGR